MRTQIMIAVAVLALGSAAASPVLAAAPCKDAKGKFIKCPAPVAHTYKLDAKGACHDEKGLMAKKTLCK